MYKVTPNPPARSNAKIIDQRAVDRLLSHMIWVRDGTEKSYQGFSPPP